MQRDSKRHGTLTRKIPKYYINHYKQIKDCIPSESKTFNKMHKFKAKIYLKGQKDICFFTSFKKNPNIFFKMK